MRIDCPHCGERDAVEFAYRGDAGPIRTDGLDVSAEAAHDALYLRDNPAGRHDELWYHASGCRAWLVVTRDTRSHAIHGVASARSVALARASDAC